MRRTGRTETVEQDKVIESELESGNRLTNNEEGDDKDLKTLTNERQ